MPVLTLLDRRYVKFSGERAAEKHCTLGQLNTLEWIGDDARAGMYRLAEWSTAVPAGVTLDDIAEVLAILMARHESLRTTYVSGAEQIQCVARSGELALDVYAMDAGDGADYGAAFAEMTSLLRSMPFDPAGQLPLRAAALVRDDVVRIALIACTHLAVDCESMALVMRQFRQLIGDPASRQVGPLGHQPVEQAVMERSDRGRRQAEATLLYWERHLMRMPQFLYAVPLPRKDGTESGTQSSGESGSGAGALTGWLQSRAVRLALPHITARTRTTLPMVIVSALCAVLSRRTDHRDLVFFMSVNNRIGTHLHEYVGSLAGDSPLAVDAEAPSFDQLARRVGTATLQAGLHGMHDVHRRIEIQNEVGRRRGTHYYRDCAVNISPFNGRQAEPDGSPADAGAALAETSLRWQPVPQFDVQLLLRVMEIDGELRIGLVSGDTAIVPASEIEVLLLAMERLLVAAAAGDVDLRRVAEVTGIAPIVRGPGWLRVDSCWVDLAEVQRLADEALAGSAPRVFAVPDAAGRLALVAYLTAGGEIQAPQDAHDACMALLSGRRAAVAPGYYVVCGRAPDNLGDRTAWAQQRVLAEGNGRTPAERTPASALHHRKRIAEHIDTTEHR